jgi:hypothetical protein
MVIFTLSLVNKLVNNSLRNDKLVLSECETVRQKLKEGTADTKRTTTLTEQSSP